MFNPSIVHIRDGKADLWGNPLQWFGGDFLSTSTIFYHPSLVQIIWGGKASIWVTMNVFYLCLRSRRELHCCRDGRWWRRKNEDFCRKCFAEKMYYLEERFYAWVNRSIYNREVLCVCLFVTFLFIYGSRSVFMGIHGSRLVIHSSRLVFHGFSWFHVGYS